MGGKTASSKLKFTLLCSRDRKCVYLLYRWIRWIGIIAMMSVAVISTVCIVCRRNKKGEFTNCMELVSDGYMYIYITLDHVLL